MADVSEEIVKNLGYLRRYARALAGSQQAGDAYVRACLEVLLQEPERVSAGADVRRQLFSLFHDVWRTVAPAEDAERNGEAPGPEALTVEARLEALPPHERQILLLT